MIKPTSVISMSVFLIACGGSGSPEYTGGTGAIQAPPGLGEAVPVATDTNKLEVKRDFAFATARTVDIEFDIEQVRNEDASVSICTDYEPDGADFDINFNSCTVNGELKMGTFNHSMEITNDKNAVIAVVLFQNQEIAPLYKVFSVDSNTRSKNDGSSQRVIVWN